MVVITEKDQYTSITINRTKKFRIYDTIQQGYVVMHNGVVVGIADNRIQAENLALQIAGV